MLSKGSRREWLDGRLKMGSQGLEDGVSCTRISPLVNASAVPGTRKHRDLNPNGFRGVEDVKGAVCPFECVISYILVVMEFCDVCQSCNSAGLKSDARPTSRQFATTL